MNPFNKTDYKFRNEGILSMYLNTFQFILGADLEMYAKEKDEVFNDKNPCHIYFILKRPKITINPDSFKSKEKNTKFDFIIHQEDGYTVVNMGADIFKAQSKLELLTEYPYNSFAIVDKQNIHLVARPSTMIDTNGILNNIQPEVLNYEVLYIGQAYGKNGKRTALNRLLAHETLQKIYTHSSIHNPESDIWILLTRFSQISVLFSLANVNTSLKENNKERDEKLVKHFIDNQGFNISENQQINFTEAALIRYFKPKYNVEFKASFPNKSHKSYSECYKLDIRALNIELDTSEHIRSIYTEHTGHKSYHSIMFEFENDRDRVDFIKITD